MAVVERTVSPTWDYRPTSLPPYFTVAPTTESDPNTVASLWAAVGTAAPSQWIGPNTLALGLGYLRPFRSDPFFFDPDLFVVGEFDARWVVTVNVRVPSNYPLVATAVNAAYEPYSFYGVLTPHEPEQVTTTFVSHTWAQSTPTATEATEDPAPAAESFAELTTQVKERSGLTDEQLGKIFPVTREQFQRWRTGKEDRPSTAHIRRMAALNEMVADAATRVEIVRDWLLIPSGGLSPYDLLCQARFEEAWRLLTQSPSSVASQLRLSEDGAWEQVPRVAVRSSNEPDNSPPITVSDDDDE